MELINCELQTRPTFRQALDSFRQCVPIITDAKIIEKERREKAQEVRKKREELQGAT